MADQDLAEEHVSDGPQMPCSVSLQCVFRRTLFALVLLTAGPMHIFVWRFTQTPGTSGLSYPSVFVWGMDGAVACVLAVWFAARGRLWRHWSPCLRAALYVIAYSYGRMLSGAAVQDSLGPPNAAFQLPGARYEDYARPALDVHALLHCTLTLAPLAALGACELIQTGEPRRRDSGFTTRGVLIYTAFVAVELFWMRFLASNYAPDTYFRSLDPAQALMEWFCGFGVFSGWWCVTAMIVLYGVSRGWLASFVAFLGGCLVNVLGCLATVAAFQNVEVLDQALGSNVFAGPMSEAVCFILGATTTLWVAFVAARLLGVRPVFGRQESGIA